MPSYDYDLFVIGAGSGGVRAARMSAAYGARVATCEESRYGGTCVIRGCVPKKLLVYASHLGEDFEDAAGYGWEAEARFSWPTLIANKNAEIARLENIYRELLANAGVDTFDGRGVLADAHTIECDGRRFTAETLLIATGGHATVPDVPGIEYSITSRQALNLEELPERVLVVGGGYIACEFAGIFNGLGSAVIQAYRGEQILRLFDRDVRDTLAEEMRKKGIDLRVGLNVTAISKSDKGLTASMTDGSVIESDAILYATGRVPNTANMGLDQAGVETGRRGELLVDEYSRTSVSHVFAVGDVTDRINLTPVAIQEGAAFARTVFGTEPTPVDHVDVPSAVFSQPPVAVVGLDEEAARDRYGDLEIYISKFRPMKYTLSGRDEMTMIKIIVAADSQRVVGCHMVGLDAPEIIQCVAIPVKMGATKAQFDATIGIHPTAAEEIVTMREVSRTVSDAK